ncbi:MAG: type III pantothenate kinase [Proteobacteria bacterium]|nr:type III pantothenate kinase [Pseudomonadota bacterium]
MLLAIDIGNTNIVFGLFAGDELICQWRLVTDAGQAADGYVAELQGLFTGQGMSCASVDAVVMASVVPLLETAFRAVCEKLFRKEPMIVNSETDTGIKLCYETPQTLGADRIVNAVAAYATCRCALIVFDFGTATTFDYVSADGLYLGGAIAPGIKTAGEALFARAAKLPRIDFIYPEHVIGVSTIESLQSGIMAGYVGLVEGIIERMKAERNENPRVIATGGLAPLIQSHTQAIDEVDAHLTLRGLKIIHERTAIGR